MYSYARLRLYELEVKGTTASTLCFDTELGVRAFAAHYLGTLTELYSGFCNRDGVCRTALGVVIGCGEPAFKLARALVRYRRASFVGRPNNACDFFNNDPINSFMELLLSEYLGEPSPLPAGNTLEDPVLAGLLECWRDPDPKVIEAACLTICDYHTHDESTNHSYIPIEILLLFKLRQLLGLENPQLDHPIMNTPLGKLPPETPLQYDDLISRVRARMILEGFDETVIFGENEEWCALRKESAKLMTPCGKDVCRDESHRGNVDSAIAAESKALVIAERSAPQGLPVFNGLRSLAVMHRLKGMNAEAARYYERALAISGQNPECDANLILCDLVTTYHDLGRTADADAVCRRYGYTWPGYASKKTETKASDQPEAEEQTVSVPVDPLQELEKSVLTFVGIGYKTAQVFLQGVSPENALSIGVLTETDAERDKLKADRMFQLRIDSVAKNKCREASRPFSGFVVESQETINRDHQGVWHPFVPERSVG